VLSSCLDSGANKEGGILVNSMKFIAVAEGILTAVRGTETFKEAVSKS